MTIKRILNYIASKNKSLSDNEQCARLRLSMKDVLVYVKEKGFNPRSIIDVGVAHGTPDIYNTFPDAFFILIEPLLEFENSLKEILQKNKGAYVIAAASSQSGSTTINVHDDHLEGSSVLKETMGPEVDGIERVVKTVTVDELVNKEKALPPYLLKVDVQGAEIDVLEGSVETLKYTELVLLEASMFKFMIGAPEFFDMVEYMKNQGFVIYDIYGGTIRPLDGALAQIDLAFVQENGRFRTDHRYALVQQWKERKK
jgi:FkbM family methyltransferase